MHFDSQNKKTDAVLAAYADLHTRLAPFYVNHTRQIDIWPDGTSNYAGVLNFTRLLNDGNLILPALCPFPMTFAAFEQYKKRIVSYCINPAAEIGTKGFAAFLIQLDRKSHLIANICVAEAKRSDEKAVHEYFIYAMMFFADPKKMLGFIESHRKYQFKFAGLEEEASLGFQAPPPFSSEGSEKH